MAQTAQWAGENKHIDATLFQENDAFGVAGIARDHLGMPIEAFTCCRKGCVAPEIAKAISMKEVLSWLERKRWEKVIIESDCLTVLQALRNNVTMPSYFGALIDECRSLWNNNEDVQITFIKRSANIVAHKLARFSFGGVDHVFCTFFLRF